MVDASFTSGLSDCARKPASARKQALAMLPLGIPAFNLHLLCLCYLATKLILSKYSGWACSCLHLMNGNETCGAVLEEESYLPPHSRLEAGELQASLRKEGEAVRQVSLTA